MLTEPTRRASHCWLRCRGEHNVQQHAGTDEAQQLHFSRATETPSKVLEVGAGGETNAH